VSAIRTLVVDDEPLSRRALRQLLARHADVEIVGECEDGLEARDALRALEPDVVFLDIRMPELSGLDVARQRGPSALPYIVFVTAFDEFALPAFEVEAVDYVTKPLTEDRFDAALARVRERLRVLAAAERTPDLTPVYTDRLVARVRDRDVIISAADIDYIEADDVYAAVHANGKRLLVRMPLDALEASLDPARFTRVHRSYIVAVSRVAAIRRASSGKEICLRDGTSLPLSRRRSAAVARLLGAARR
jgi:two-component system LytT family response regulator